MHQFARCLEGLILPEEGRTRAQFVHRAQTFAVASEGARIALEQIYDILSKIEHLHNALDFLPDNPDQDREELLYRLARQADQLARSSIAHVLENEGLTEIFKTDASISAFWKLPDHERLRLWGDRLDLESIA
jgi:hypothetical protein